MQEGMELPDVVSHYEYPDIEEEDDSPHLNSASQPLLPVVSPLHATRRAPRSILRNSDGDILPRVKKSVRWCDLQTDKPLATVLHIPLSGVDRSSIDSQYLRDRRRRRKEQDQFLFLCCGGIISVFVIFVFCVVFFIYSAEN